ncbi:MAG: hypothetical protein WCR49_12940 [Opitutae bacterium]
MKLTSSLKIVSLSIGLLLLAAVSATAAPGPTVLVNPVTGTCSPDVVVITQKHGKDVTITFEIDPAAGDNWSWSADPEPIVVGGAGSVFSDGHHPGGNGKGKVKLKNRNLPADVGTYKYTANLIQAGSSTPVSIDPSIQNKLD